MKPFTYLLLLFFTIIFCFTASFDRRIRFDRFFAPFLKAAALVAIPFIAWDIWFTAKGVWWFDTSYTLGISPAGLPLEEWLFFICIPFSCVFTYHCIDKFYHWEALSGFNNILVFVFVILCSLMALLHLDKIYTFVTAVVAVTTLIYLHFIARIQWTTKATVIYGILMLGFFPVNGILTGLGLSSPIVNYIPAGFMGKRILTIPVEDAVYGYAQFLWVLYFFKRLKKY